MSSDMRSVPDLNIVVDWVTGTCRASSL